MNFWGVIFLTVVFICSFCEVRGQQDFPDIPSTTSCPPCNCRAITSCVGDHSAGDCECCKICGDIGDACGEGGKECIGDLLCLPNDPYSSNYDGKCYELSDCLSFGCTDETGECNCLYSSSCPIKRFPYYTLEECNESLLRKKCEGVVCPPQLTAQDCKKGMYFEQGPSYFDECCPVIGSCVCNMSMCSSPPECGMDSELVVVKKSNESMGECCNVYECQKVIKCDHEGKQYSLNDTWEESACKKCHCTADGVYCTYMNCSQLDECKVTYVPEGACCPVCFEPGNPNRPDNYIPEDNACITENGLSFIEGETFSPGPCRFCRCENKQLICEEKSCEPLVCGDDEVYAVMEEECCPKCIAKTPLPTMDEDTDQTMQGPMDPLLYAPTPTHGMNTMSADNKETTLPPSNPSPSNNPASSSASNLELVMVLSAPFSEVNNKWEEFSQELSLTLNDYSTSPVAMDIKEDMGKAVLILNIKMADNKDGLSKEDLSESQLALMVSRTAQEYSFVEEQEQDYENENLSVLGMNESEFNVTIIVLTLIAAIALLSFIGIAILLVLITRRLKTMKAIRAHSYKKPTTLRP